MKIAHVNMFYKPTFGGVEKVMEELAKRQIAEGHEVHVFCCDSDKHNRIKLKEEIIDGVHVHRSRYWLRLSMSTFIWPGLILKLPKYKFDVIHSHVSGHAYVLLTGIIAKLKKTPHVHTTHCPWTDAFRPLAVRIPLFFTDKIFNKIAFKLCTKIIAITPWEIPILEKWVNKNKINIIPNGTDKVFFEKLKSNNFKKEHNIKGKIVLYLGRLNVTKGADKFVLAAKEILKQRNDLTFVILGPDEGLKSTIKEMIKDEKNILLLEPTTERKKIVELYQASSVYVLPSYREGLPLTLFEAMASGLPVVASPVNGVPFEMKEPDNGFLVKYGDIKNLKLRILEVIDNPELAKKMALNNIKKARQYDWDEIYKKYMNLYTESISEIHNH